MATQMSGTVPDVHRLVEQETGQPLLKALLDYMRRTDEHNKDREDTLRDVVSANTESNIKMAAALESLAKGQKRIEANQKKSSFQKMSSAVTGVLRGAWTHRKGVGVIVGAAAAVGLLIIIFSYAVNVENLNSLRDLFYD
jgi:hypothetical protein